MQINNAKQNSKAKQTHCLNEQIRMFPMLRTNTEFNIQYFYSQEHINRYTVEEF